MHTPTPCTTMTTLYTVSLRSMTTFTPCLCGQWLHLCTPCLCGQWLHLHHVFVVNYYTCTVSLWSMTTPAPCLCGQWLHLHHVFVVNDYTCTMSLWSMTTPAPCLCGYIFVSFTNKSYPLIHLCPRSQRPRQKGVENLLALPLLSRQFREILDV